MPLSSKRFNKVAKNIVNVDDLITFIKKSDNVTDIDRALRGCSAENPFYPDDQKLISFFRSAKKDTDLDKKFLLAAKTSAHLREKALLKTRQPNRQGGFTHFIYIDPHDDNESKIFKLERASHIGSGLGAWGGLRELQDADIGVTVQREAYEEVIDCLRLYLRVKAADQASTLEKSFDDHLAAADKAGEPLSNGTIKFVKSLSENEMLFNNLKVFVEEVHSLTDDLLAAEKEKLFFCRDDRHAIDRGWGFILDAHAHVARISEDTARKFKNLNDKIDVLKKEARQNGISIVAGEMQGIVGHNLSESPDIVKQSHYGHEGFAEMIGFARFLARDGKLFRFDPFLKPFKESGALYDMADKMNLQGAQLEHIFKKLVADKKPRANHYEIADHKYQKAFKAKQKRDISQLRKGKV